MALENTGSTLARPGGGAVGVIGHDVSTAGVVALAAFLALVPFLAAFLAARASSAALAGADSGSFLALASAVAARLLGPRIGSRGVKIHPDAGDRLAADQPSVVEEPGVLPVELLEGVVGQDDGTGALGDAQHEGVPPADGPRRRGDDLPVEHRLAHLLALGVGDPVLEGRVDDHDDARAGVLGGVRAYGLVELLQARGGSPFGGQVGPIHDDVMRFSQWHVARDRPAPTGAGRRSRWRGWPTRGGSRGGVAGGRAGRRAAGRGRRTRHPCSRAPPAATPPRWHRGSARRCR